MCGVGGAASLVCVERGGAAVGVRGPVLWRLPSAGCAACLSVHGRLCGCWGLIGWAVRLVGAAVSVLFLIFLLVFIYLYTCLLNYF